MILWGLPLFGDATSAQSLPERSLPVEGLVDQAEGVVTLSWPSAERQIIGAVEVNRRRLGETGPDTWRPLAPPRTTAVWRDADLRSGQAYEYQVVRSQRAVVDAGYWAAGWEVPTLAQRGVVLLVIDEEVVEPLSQHLIRLRRDLVGAGWDVMERHVPRHVAESQRANLQAAIAIRSWIIDQVADDPFAEHAIFLIGHVPIVLSGQAAPDGHGARPHPTDAFYADLDGQWRANLDGLLLHNTVPGNGIELQVGRVDFSALAGNDHENEVRLLQQYLDKNHHWRHGLYGDLRRAYANNRNLLVEQHALLNLLSSNAIVEGGHNDTDAEGAWLWGVDFGSWNFDDYFASSGGASRGPVFAINFGSHKQMFNARRNAMVALLAQPWYTVAVGWGGRPAWRLHLMALGGSIGEVHRRTLNNGTLEGAYPDEFEYFPTGNYVFRQPVWVNLLGDPTLGAYPLAPPAHPVVEQTGSSGRLSWDASPDADTVGYRVFRLVQGGAAAELVSDLDVLNVQELEIEGDVSAEQYFIRAYGLKETPAGSFFTHSQGAYAVPADRILPDLIRMDSGSEETVFIPSQHMQDGQRYLISIVQSPESGQVVPVPGGWHYTPEDRDSHEANLQISIFDGQASRVADLEVRWRD